MYGRTQLIGNIISKAREKVKGHYGLKGDAEKISSDVKWLLEKAHFVFGDLNVEVCFNFISNLLLTCTNVGP